MSESRISSGSHGVVSMVMQVGVRVIRTVKINLITNVHVYYVPVVADFKPTKNKKVKNKNNVIYMYIKHMSWWDRGKVLS